MGSNPWISIILSQKNNLDLLRKGFRHEMFIFRCENLEEREGLHKV